MGVAGEALARGERCGAAGATLGDGAGAGDEQGKAPRVGRYDQKR
jgi:hypothetical protein